MLSSSTTRFCMLVLILPFATAEPEEHCIAGSSACPVKAEPDDVTSLLMTRLEVNQRTEPQIETQSKGGKGRGGSSGSHSGSSSGSHSGEASSTHASTGSSSSGNRKPKPAARLEKKADKAAKELKQAKHVERKVEKAKKAVKKIKKIEKEAGVNGAAAKKAVKEIVHHEIKKAKKIENEVVASAKKKTHAASASCLERNAGYGGPLRKGNICMCKAGDDCVSGKTGATGFLFAIEHSLFGNNEQVCFWSPPDAETTLPKVNQHDGNYYFDHASCPTCKCIDGQARNRAVHGDYPVDMQLASLASLIYQDTPCPDEKQHTSDRWTTKAGWKLATHKTQKGIVSICQNTRENEHEGDLSYVRKSRFSANQSSKASAHDNFALFVNEKGNRGDGDGGVPPKTCVMAIQGTTFDGFKNWKNDLDSWNSPWCGESVHRGFKAEIMQFFGSWGIPENEELIGKPGLKGHPIFNPKEMFDTLTDKRGAAEAIMCDKDHYTQELFDEEMKYKMSTMLPPMAAFIEKNCDHFWTTGHSLGAALAEMFAMCWNKGGMGGAAPVSRVYTIAGPAAFAVNKIPACDGKPAIKTVFPKCFGGQRAFLWDDEDENSKVPPHFDPVPVGASLFGFQHLPYNAVQLGNQKRTTTKCYNKRMNKVMKIPEFTPEIKEFMTPKLGHLATMAFQAWDMKNYLKADGMMHMGTAYMERLDPIYYEDLDEFEDAEDS